MDNLTYRSWTVSGTVPGLVWVLSHAAWESNDPRLMDLPPGPLINLGQEAFKQGILRVINNHLKRRNPLLSAFA